MRYVIIIQLITGQQVGLLPPYPTQEACMADLALIQAGVHRVITLDNGLVIPVRRGVGCQSEAEYQAQQARQSGGV